MKALSITEAAQILELAAETVEIAKGFSPGKNGGYVCIADNDTGAPLLISIVGEVPEGKAEKYCTLAQEKALRLGKHPDHLASWQSRDDSKEQYGGAVRGRGFIFSFSGFSPDLDEAVMLILAFLLDNIGREIASMIVEITGNKVFPELQYQLRKKPSDSG